MNATGKATLKAIKNAVNKAATPGKGKPNQRRPVAAGGKPAVTTGLKITFKPKELGQTTPSQVLQQIKGALAKQGKPRAPGQTVSSNYSSCISNVSIVRVLTPLYNVLFL